MQPDKQNANKGTKRGREMVEASLRELGAGRSIVVDAEGRIIAGNKTVEAAKLMDLPIEVVQTDGSKLLVVQRNDLNLAEDTGKARKLAYVDNRAAEMGLAWNAEQMLADLNAGVDFKGFFDEKELNEILAGVAGKNKLEDAEPQIDKAEELRQKWGVESGQLWQLGKHRLICGDCTDMATVDRLMQGERATLAPVDPPYNVGFDYDGKTVDDTKSDEIYEQFSREWFGVCQSVSNHQIVTPGGINHIKWARWFDSFHCGVWIKTNASTFGKVSNSWCWEPVFFFGSKWSRKRPNDVFDYPIGNQKDVANHPCPKPLTMWLDLVENYSEPNDIVFESFSGSGTTIIACEQLKRQCRAVEISPAYVAVALERWATVTSKTPVLLKDE